MIKNWLRNAVKYFVIACMFVKAIFSVRYEITSLHVLLMGIFYTPILDLANSFAKHPSTLHFVIWFTCYITVFLIADKLTGIKRIKSK